MDDQRHPGLWAGYQRGGLVFLHLLSAQESLEGRSKASERRGSIDPILKLFLSSSKDPMIGVLMVYIVNTGEIVCIPEIFLADLHVGLLTRYVS